MKIICTVALAALAALCPIRAQALETDTPPPAGYELLTDTATVMIVSIASHQFTSISGLSGSHYIVAQSTDATASFCCSFESGASTTTVAGTRGCLQAGKDPGGAFYQLSFKRWARDLTLWCQSFKTDAVSALRVLQGR